MSETEYVKYSNQEIISWKWFSETKETIKTFLLQKYVHFYVYNVKNEE